MTTARPSCFPQPVSVSMHVTGCSCPAVSAALSLPPQLPLFPVQAGIWLEVTPSSHPALLDHSYSPQQENLDPRALLQNIPIPMEYFHFIIKLHLGVDAASLQGGEHGVTSALLTDGSSYPSIPDVSLLFSPPFSHPGCVPSTHSGNSLAVSGTQWPSRGGLPVGTAARPQAQPVPVPRSQPRSTVRPEGPVFPGCN